MSGTSIRGISETTGLSERIVRADMEAIGFPVAVCNRIRERLTIHDVDSYGRHSLLPGRHTVADLASRALTHTLTRIDRDWPADAVPQEMRVIS